MAKRRNCMFCTGKMKIGGSGFVFRLCKRPGWDKEKSLRFCMCNEETFQYCEKHDYDTPRPCPFGKVDSKG